MNRKEFLSVRRIFPDDTIDELRRVRAGNPLFDKEICEYKKLLEEDGNIDESYKKFMLCLVNMDENFEPQKELQDKDDIDINKSEPTRKQKRGRKKKIVPSNQMNPTRSRVTNKIDKVENVMKVNRPRKQKLCHSNQMTVRLTRSRTKLANEVEVETEKGSQDLVSVSHARKLNRVAKPKNRPSNQTSNVENHQEYDRQYNSVKKTNQLTKRKSTNDADRMEKMKALPNDMVPDLQYHHLDRNVTLEDDQHGYMRKARKQKVGPSNEMLDVEKKRKCDKPSCSRKKTNGLAKRKVKLEVDKVYRVKGAPNDMVLDSDNWCDPQLRKKLKRDMKQNVGTSNQMPGVENKRKGDQPPKKKKGLTRRILMDEVKVENMKDSSIDLVSYPEYVDLDDALASYPEYIDFDDPLASYPDYIDLDDDHDSYMHKGNTVANDEKNCGANDVKTEHKDDSDSDVEILDSEAIIEGRNLSAFVPSKRVHYSMDKHSGRSSEGEFRKQVLNVLRKPFDKEEYVRHREAAKCYLDQYPDLRRKVAKYRCQQDKCLTIYRGFFFWLQNLTQEGSFKPWTDPECLAVEPQYL